MNAKHVEPRVAALLASVWLSGCALALPRAQRAHEGEPTERFVLAKLHREAPAVTALDAWASTGTVELRPGAAVTVRAADSCGVVSNDAGRQGQCALAVDGVTAALLAAGFRVVHYSAFSEQRALAARVPLPSAEPKKHDSAKAPATQSDDAAKPSETDSGSLGVEQVLVVDVATLSRERRVSSDSLALFISDAQGHERAPLSASAFSAELSAFALARSPAPFLGSEARLEVSVVAVQDGHVALHYDAGARQQAALASERHFLFHAQGDYFEPVLPLPASVAPAAETLSTDSAPPSELFDRLGKDLVEHLRSAKGI